MSPGMRKLSILFTVFGVVAFGWWFFRMPSPAVAGLERPTLTLMESGDQPAQRSRARATGQRPDRSKSKATTRTGARSARERRAAARTARSRARSRLNNNSESAQPKTATKPATLRSMGRTGPATTNSTLNKQDWRTRRREALERRRSGEAAGVIAPLEELENLDLSDLPPEAAQIIQEEAAQLAEELYPSEAGDEGYEGDVIE